jgi:predicted nucleotidyltransferase
MDTNIRYMRTAAPLLLPLFRSANQGQILAALYLSDGEEPIAALAEKLAVPYTTVHREVTQLLAAGLLAERRVGNARLIGSNVTSPFYSPLRQLLELAFGPVPLLRTEFESINGINSSAIFGSWAHRALGEPGPPPADIDVLVVGAPDVTLVYAACSRVGQILGRPVNATILTETEWSESTPFLDEVRRAGMLTITSPGPETGGGPGGT